MAPTPAPTAAPLAARVYTDTIAEDAQAFLGADGLAQAGMVARLSAGDADTAARLKVQAGVEVRSKSSLTLDSDWNLVGFNQLGQTLARPGDQPIQLTLRAASDLNIAASLSDGLRNRVVVSDDPEAQRNLRAQAAAIQPESFILPGTGASFRLVGGADLGAADVLATQYGAAGDVRIGNSTGKAVIVRTTTGNIDVAAARDVQLLNRQAVVYTTGKPIDTLGLPNYLPPSGSLLIDGAEDRQAPFLSGGGSVSLHAGRDLVGGSNGNTQYTSDWWWRYNGGTSGSVAWWNRYDLFQQGVATLGGGSVQAHAGRDALGIGLSAAGSGVLLPTPVDGSARTAALFGGGSVDLMAGRDIVDTQVLAAGAWLSVTAGRDVGAGNGSNGLQLMHQDTAVDLTARNDLTLGRVISPGMAAPLAQQRIFATNGLLIGGLAPQASLTATSSAGNLTYTGRAPDKRAGAYSQESRAQAVVPAWIELAAPLGDMRLAGDLVQAPVADTHFQALAQGKLQLSNLAVAGSQERLGAPFATSGAAIAPLLEPFPKQGGSLGSGAREPIHLAAGSGDLTIGTLRATQAVRAVAGTDLKITTLVAQHQDGSELTVLQAGRDVVFDAATSDNSFSAKLHGPGELIIVAGHDINLGTSGGIGTVGNLENSALRTGGAQLTLLAGGQPDAAMLAAALARYLPTGVNTPSAADGPSATDTQVYLARLQAFVQSRGGPQVGGAAQARQAFANLPLEARWLFMQSVLFDELRASGRLAAASAGAERDAAYARGFAALTALFPGTGLAGDIRMTSSQIKTQQGGSIRLLAPGGGINAGETFTGGAVKPAAAIGIVTVAGGAVEMAVQGSVIINQSRVFTVGQGDVLIWASRGDIDAGRGAKTVTGAPPPLFKIDSNGNVVVDTSGSFAGSGIAVLDARSTLDLFAPAGEINAGDAGIQSAGNANLAAQRFAGTDAIAVKGDTSGGAPPAAVSAVASLAPTAPPPTTAAAAAAGGDTEDDDRKKRRRRNLLLDFLGFSRGD